METMILRARPVLPARQWLSPSCSLAKTAAASIAHPKPAATVAASTRRRLSALNRPPPKYPGHVPLTMLERAGLAVGSGIPAFLYPQRADMVAAFGEATATPFFLRRLRDAMLAHPTGRRILRQRPRINSKTISLPDLRALPESTLGRTYVAWVDREGVTPDSRDPVRYVDDEECAYVMQRYRECHDFYHALLGLPTFREAELALKAFEFASTLLPVAGLSLFAAATLKPDQRRRFLSVYLPWAVRNGARCQTLLNVYWEEELGRDVDDLRRELGIERPPDMREMRRQARLRKRREVEEAQGA